MPHKVSFNSLLRVLFCFCLAGFWLAGLVPGLALASGMALADEDMLSDVSAQVGGMSFVLEGRGTVGVIAFRGSDGTVSTGTLSYRNISITGPGAGGRFSLGQREHSTHRVTLDVGSSGGQARMRLRFPNMFFSNAAISREYITIEAAQSWWGDFTNGIKNLGSFTLGEIMHNNSQITMWAGNGGVRGLVELNAKIGQIQNRPIGGRGFRFENFAFSNLFGGTLGNDLMQPGTTAPLISDDPGDGYASFGTSVTPLTIDVYTDQNNVNRTRMRIYYMTTGTAVIQNIRILDTAGGVSHSFGPIILHNWGRSDRYPGSTFPGITITGPISLTNWAGPPP